MPINNTPVFVLSVVQSRNDPPSKRKGNFHVLKILVIRNVYVARAASPVRAKSTYNPQLTVQTTEATSPTTLSHSIGPFIIKNIIWKDEQGVYIELTAKFEA